MLLSHFSLFFPARLLTCFSSKAEYVPATLPAEAVADPDAFLSEFLVSLLPPIDDLRHTSPKRSAEAWRRVGVKDASQGWEDPVERGRRSAFLLLEILRAESMV